jgi:ElaA protein
MEWILKRFSELSSLEMYEILHLRNEVFIVEQKCPYQDIDDKDKYGFHLFAKDEKKTICAYLRILDQGQTFDEISIGRVIIRKDMRGTGLGQKMLLKAIEFIENTLKEHKIRIAAQAHLQNFYKAVGFIPCSEVFLEDNIPHIEMIYSN